METDIDTESDLGHFGWEELISGFVIPYIVRENKKYCSLDIFTKHVARSFHLNMKDDDLQKFDDLQTHSVTLLESYLFNEINHLHCDSLYDHNFKCGDTLVELNDVKQMTQFFYDCHQKLSYGDDYDLKNCGILSIRIKKDDTEYLVPYVRLDHKPYVPISKCTFYTATPRRYVKLTGINLQYMKFMHKVLRMQIDDIQLCAPFEEIEAEIGKKQMQAYEYWPGKDLCDRFYPSMEPAIRTFVLSDDSSTESQHEFPLTHATSSTSEQQQEPQAQTTDERPLEMAEPVVDTNTENAEFDENGNSATASVNLHIQKRMKIAADKPKISKEKNKKRTKSSSTQKKSKKPKAYATPSGEYYPIERILEHREDAAGNIFCLVRWENFSPSHDTWEPFDNFTDDMKSEITMNF